MAAAAASPATTRNGTRQLVCWPTNVPSGTPITVATVRPVNISPIARPSWPGSAVSAATMAPTAKKAPWADAVTTRPSISSSNVGATASSRCATANPAMSVIKTVGLAIRRVANVRIGPPTAMPTA